MQISPTSGYHTHCTHTHTHTHTHMSMVWSGKGLVNHLVHVDPPMIFIKVTIFNVLQECILYMCVYMCKYKCTHTHTHISVD